MLNSKLDKVRRYRQALSINASVWVLQLITVLFIADSLTLFGDMSHSIADIFILLATHQVFAHELRNPNADHSHKKKWLVRVAVFLLWLSACYVLYEALGRITHPVDFPGWPVAILAIFSASGNFFAHHMISKIDACEHDHAHEANVAHLLTDFALSIIVLVSALGNILFNLPAIDAWLSLVVAMWMLYWGWKIIHGKDDEHHHHH